jgi:hypothetical protein
VRELPANLISPSRSEAIRRLVDIALKAKK